MKNGGIDLHSKKKRIIFATVAIIMIFAMVFSLLLPVLGAAASTSDELNSKYSDLKKRLEDIENQKKKNNSQLDENNKKADEIKKQKSKIDSQIGIIKQQISILNNQISQNQSNINALSSRIEDTQKKIDRNTELYKERICALYESGAVSRLQVLLSSTDIMDFLTRFDIIKMISEHDNNLLTELNNEKRQIQSDKAKLETEKKGLQSKLSQVNAKQADLNSQSLKSAQYLEQLNAMNQQIQANNKALENEKDETEDELAEASREIENYLKSIQNSGKSNPSPFGGQFIWPASGSVSCEFGGYKGHTGIDITGTSGVTPIKASAAGIVVKVGHWNKSIPRSSAGYGNYVLIDNGTDKSGNRIATVYAHMYDNSICVSEGQHVEQGQVIGKLGNSGNVRSHGSSPSIGDLVSGAHLHFEIRINGQAVNPRNYLG